MNINDNCICGTETQMKLIAHGYAVKELCRVQFEFFCLEDLQGAPQPDSNLINTIIQKNMVMKPIMDAIAGEFCCYQYGDTYKGPYDSAEWELYFCSWVFKAQGTTVPDLSHFVLSFNHKHTMAQRKCICDRLLNFLTDKFVSNPNLRIDIQYTAVVDTEKVDRDAKRILPTLIGKPCVYKRMLGKIEMKPQGAFFMKKHAKKYGYGLSEEDILEISWDMKSAT